ncbi:LytR/AlgR family response regulator transcription factor [Pseudoxanthomonas winnipegensis]|uniref:LytR/AlgR family response regulator transcription factor n=1 Tax=Pseudoxanthomonas winnipegensis TaxID=2480810 RepID=UPI001F327D13|nr:LytTR family DNA-binding domain-containing protein [Pseudoxanthomonas winnipegensis]
MIRIAVIDDEPLARSGVIASLARHGDVRIVGEYADGQAALAGLPQCRPDVLILDIQMPSLDGIALLQAMESHARPLVILLTAHAEFAVPAFALEVLDYLLKPLDEERLADALARVRRRLQASASVPVPPPGEPRPEPFTRFEVRVGRRIVFVPVEEVEYLQADGDYVTLHVGSRQYLLRDALQRLQTQLDPTRFVRIHRSTMVRLDCVAELQPLSNKDALLRLHNGAPLRVSRTYVDALRAQLTGASG